MLHRTEQVDFPSANLTLKPTCPADGIRFCLNTCAVLNSESTINTHFLWEYIPVDRTSKKSVLRSYRNVDLSIGIVSTDYNNNDIENFVLTEDDDDGADDDEQTFQTELGCRVHGRANVALGAAPTLVTVADEITLSIIWNVSKIVHNVF